MTYRNLSVLMLLALLLVIINPLTAQETGECGE